MLLIVIALAVFEGIDGAKSTEHYCAISKDHTMCLYNTFNSMGLRCRHFHPIPTNGVKRMMLKKHNSLRNAYASHSIRPFTVPNMLGLEWDDELTEIAARWAMQCPYYEDDFRDVDRFKVANMVSIGSHQTSFPTLLEVWGTITNSNITFHKLPDGFKRRIHHKLESAFMLDQPMTLITNPYFKYVGCAAAIYRQFVIEDEMFRTILVCNYGPLNDSYDNEQPNGLPCTRCPNDTHCHQHSSYPNLCFGATWTHHSKEEKLHQMEPQAIVDWYEDDVDESNEDGSAENVNGARTNDSSDSLDFQSQINNTDEYCDIVCGNGKRHVMCKYQGITKEFDGAVPLLGKPSEAYLLSLHNVVRDELGANKVTSDDGPTLPWAANMREVVWSKELARFADRWSMQCTEEKDECRDMYMEDDSIPTYVSQLIYVTNWTGMGAFPSVTDAFYHWVSGLPYFSEDVLNPYKEPTDLTKDYSSYAQVIWASSYLMGCAMAMCHTNNSISSRIVTVCNYAPGGLVPGMSVYRVGGPCSDCPKLHSEGSGASFCSMEYANLCAVRLNEGNRPPVHDLDQMAVDKLLDDVISKISENGTITKTFREDGSIKIFSGDSEEDIDFPDTILDEKSAKILPNDPSCGYKCFSGHNHSQHTLCKYKGPSTSCKSLLIHNAGIDRAVVRLHNDVRDAIASGLYTQKTLAKLEKLNFPKASNMREMVWNKQLAESALRWASQCQIGLDTCRDLKLAGGKKYKLNKHEVPTNDLMRVRQMVAMKAWDEKFDQPSIEEFFDAWLDEVVNFSIPSIAHYKKNKKLMSDHFVQLIWARTYMVGCALVSWADKKPGLRILYLVCNYAPRGLQETFPVYNIGGPCTTCEGLYSSGTEGRTCSRQRISLCKSESN